MRTNQFGNEVDPDDDWCPWCGSVRRWRGRHAAAKHPEEWAQFKREFVEEKTTETRWVRRDE